MTDSARPWCLHWRHDGELDSSDRHDLLQRLLVTEQGLVRQVLARSVDRAHPHPTWIAPRGSR